MTQAPERCPECGTENPWICTDGWRECGPCGHGWSTIAAAPLTASPAADRAASEQPLYLWEHDSLTPRVASVEDARAFTGGNPRWTRCYPVELFAAPPTDRAELAEIARWMHAAYDRPPQTPEVKAVLASIDALARSTDAPPDEWTLIAPDGMRFSGASPLRAASAAARHDIQTDPVKAKHFHDVIASLQAENDAENARLLAEHGTLNCPACGGSGHIGDAAIPPSASTSALREAPEPALWVERFVGPDGVHGKGVRIDMTDREGDEWNWLSLPVGIHPLYVLAATQAPAVPAQRGSLLQRVMARLADMLDDDKFNEINGMVKAAGVEPPEPRTSAVPATDAPAGPFGWREVSGKQHDTGRVTRNEFGSFFADTASPEDARLIAEAMNRLATSAPAEAPTDAMDCLRQLVNALDATSWSSWQTTTSFANELEQAHAALTQATSTEGKS